MGYLYLHLFTSKGRHGRKDTREGEAREGGKGRGEPNSEAREESGERGKVASWR